MPMSMNSALRAPKRVRSDEDDSSRSGSGSGHGSAGPASQATAGSPTSPPDGARPGFSALVKTRMQSSTRIGQACDRCKVRKIRCDALPEGCSHCRVLQVPCFVTDRVTGRTERRGYLQELERDKVAMAEHIRQLETLLREQAGIEVQPWAAAATKEPLLPPPWKVRGSVRYRPAAAAADANTGTAAATVVDIPDDDDDDDDDDDNSLGDPPDRAASTPATNYLGVFADRAPLNSVNGTQISILGTLLDIDAGSWADVEPQPSAVYREPTGLYNRSMGSYMRSIMGVNPPLGKVDLPAYADAIEYSEWYFLMVNPFAPVLHKPTYMELLARIYEDRSFTPSTAELVIVHMVFACIYYQYGIRNREELSRQLHLHDLSNKHYHWALSKYYDLAADSSLASVQAAVIIALYTRAFPKPGCGATAAHFAVNKAIDLGLHRRDERGGGRGGSGGAITLDGELRKRAWWTALMLSTTLNGRLGRPMPIALDEFDTELPVAIADEHLPAAGGAADTARIGRDCPFLIGLHAYRITPLYMEMFAGVYGARRDARRYPALVRRLEARCDALDATVPAELDTARCKPRARVYALYARAMSLEFRLCLRHPSVCRTADPAVFAYNTRRCADAARALLRVVQQLLVLKSLDTTWYQMSVYCAALFSLLAAAWERRCAVSAADLAQLHEETSTWLSIIAEISLLTGASASGQPFNRRLTRICARTIRSIQRDRQAAVGAPPPPHSRPAVPAHRATDDSTTTTSDSPTSSSYVDSMARQLEAAAHLRLQDRMGSGQQLQQQQEMSRAAQQRELPRYGAFAMHPKQRTPSAAYAAVPSMDMDGAAYGAADANGYGHHHQRQNSSRGGGMVCAPYVAIPLPDAPIVATAPPTTTPAAATAGPLNPWTNWTAAMVGDGSWGGTVTPTTTAATETTAGPRDQFEALGHDGGYGPLGAPFSLTGNPFPGSSGGGGLLDVSMAAGPTAVAGGAMGYGSGTTAATNHVGYGPSAESMGGMAAGGGTDTHTEQWPLLVFTARLQEGGLGRVGGV